VNSRERKIGRFFALLAMAAFLVAAAQAAENGFTQQARVGFTVGDQWEPAIAADGYQHVYILYPQYKQIPNCTKCPIPSMTLVVSGDNGTTWEAPRQITPPAGGQFDAQIVVDPADRRTVYAAWLANDRRDAVVAKSADFGQSWSVVVAEHDGDDADKPTLAVRGQDVYLGFNREHSIHMAVSHDGGVTFVTSEIGANMKLVRALAGGSTVDPAGNVYLAWAGYARADGARGRLKLYVSKSADGGQNWRTKLIDSSGAPPDCSAQRCEWGFLGAQITMASDAAGTLYALWNAGSVDHGAERVYFATSTTSGETWSDKQDVSEAKAGVEHAFPAIAAGDEGDVRIAWMDRRAGLRWNTYYRSSDDGGDSWSDEQKLSGYVAGYHYIQPHGFSFPFGDYFEIDIDSQGQTQAVWGEGLNYKTPGSIWHSREVSH
jgi:hypothetical protein